MTTGKKRANGEGSLRKRPDGRWEGRYTAGRDPVTGKAIYKNVLAKTQKAGIAENLPFHGLRHTFATLAIQQGVDVKTVSNILGHYSAGFTLDTYAHVTGDMRREAADRMGGFIAQAI